MYKILKDEKMDIIIRTSDGAIIPICEGNKDYKEYVLWLSKNSIEEEIKNN